MVQALPLQKTINGWHIVLVADGRVGLGNSVVSAAAMYATDNLRIHLVQDLDIPCRKHHCVRIMEQPRIY
eukprot:456624-Karenia_brevis.AAC.1